MYFLCCQCQATCASTCHTPNANKVPCQVPSAMCQVPSATCLPRAKCEVPSAKFQMPSAKCELPSAKCRLPSSKCQCHVALEEKASPPLFMRSMECPKLQGPGPLATRFQVTKYCSNKAISIHTIMIFDEIAMISNRTLVSSGVDWNPNAILTKS